MDEHVKLPGSVRKLAPASRPAGPIDPGERALLTIRIRPAKGDGDLAKFVEDLNAKPPSERTYLTRRELAERNGAAPEDLDLVEEVAQQHNLAVVRRSAAERVVVLHGRLRDLLAAFPAELHMYHSDAGAYRGRRGPLYIPANLEGVVTGVSGYDTRPKHRSRFFRAGPGGSNGQSPAAFAKRYQFPETFNGATLDGSGQTIAIIELGGGYRTSDLTVYFHEVGSPRPKVSWLPVDGAVNSPSTSDSADGEVMLDIEVAGVVAPKAKIAVYFGPNAGNRGFLDAITKAVHDEEHKPGVISISWGSPEDGLADTDKTAFSQVFAEAAAVGVTICVASGDHGVADLDVQHWDKAIHVDHPACDPGVLACGGTQIVGDKDVVWNDGQPFDVNSRDGGGWTSGGGISTLFPVPAYQKTLSMPASLGPGGKPGRGVPDIAMSATDYFVRVDSAEGASGGTSAVAPLMAGLIARLNQAKGKGSGFLNGFLYANAAQVMTDVTSGDNGIAKTVKGYPATAGWDPCTGLGTPIGTAILGKL